MSNVIRTLQILRESISSDEEYLTAVSMGNELRAQALVDEAAKRAGYNIGPVYHGTKVPYISKFRTNADSEFGAHFAEDSNIALELGENVYCVYLKGNFYDLVSDLGQWSDMRMWLDYLSDMELFNPDEIAQIEELNNIQFLQNILIDKGVTGIKYVNSFEGLDSTHMMLSDTPDSYIVFSPEQIKLADPVTYDDDGDVIPLSERFNPNSNDIRY